MLTWPHSGRCRSPLPRQACSTCQVTGILLPGAVHLALMAGQHFLHQVQHAKVLHNVVEEDGICGEQSVSPRQAGLGPPTKDEQGKGRQWAG